MAPAKGKEKQGAVSLSEFELSDQGHVLACPEGQKPLVSKKRIFSPLKNYYELHPNSI